MSLLSQLQPRKQSAVSQAIARHDAFISEFVDYLSRHSGKDRAERYISVIARSPESPAVRALIARRDDLQRCGASIQAIFADLGPGGVLAECAHSLTGLHVGTGARDSFRWARNACLMDAHEQVILGKAMCWSGDCMRREPGKVNALDLFERDAPKVVRLGTLAFDAIWAICEPVPANRLRIAAAKPSASFAPGDEGRLSAFSFLRKPERSNPLAH